MKIAKVEAIAFEMPVVYRNAYTASVLAQLVGALRYVAFAWTEDTYEINPGKRLAALGLSPRMRRGEAKRAVLMLVNARFGLKLKPKDHDIADAIAVGLAAMKEMTEQRYLEGEA